MSPQTDNGDSPHIVYPDEKKKERSWGTSFRILVYLGVFLVGVGIIFAISYLLITYFNAPQNQSASTSFVSDANAPRVLFYAQSSANPGIDIQLYTARIDGSQVQEVQIPASNGIAYERFILSPDRKKVLAWSTAHTHVLAFTLDNPSESMVLNQLQEGSWLTDAEWSVDGSHVAIVENRFDGFDEEANTDTIHSQINIVESGGGELRSVATHTDLDGYIELYRFQNNKLIYQKGSLYAGRESSITPTGDATESAQVVTETDPDGADTITEMLDLTNNAAVLLEGVSEPSVGGNYMFSSQDDVMWYYQRQNLNTVNLVEYRFSTSEQRTLFEFSVPASESTGRVTHLSHISPDGTRVLKAHYDESSELLSLELANLESREVNQISAGKSQPVFPSAWSYNGTYVWSTDNTKAFQEVNHVIRVEDGVVAPFTPQVPQDSVTFIGWID